MVTEHTTTRRSPLRQPPTLEEVAKAAGVSRSTASRAINGGLNGKEDRDKFWRTAKSVLGC